MIASVNACTAIPRNALDVDASDAEAGGAAGADTWAPAGRFIARAATVTAIEISLRNSRRYENPAANALASERLQPKPHRNG